MLKRTFIRQSELFGKFNLFTNSKYIQRNFTNKKQSDAMFFYENANVGTADDNKNLIDLKKDSNMKSKLTIDEQSERPLIENETYRELYRNFSLYIGEENSKELDTIIHNQERNGKIFKYGLPAKNELPFTELITVEEKVDLPSTSTENIFSLLSLDKDSSFESLVIKFQSEFNHGKYFITKDRG